MGTAKKLEGNVTIVKYDARGTVTVGAGCGRRLHIFFFPWFKYSVKHFATGKAFDCL